MQPAAHPLPLASGVIRVDHLDVTALLAQASHEERALFVLPFRGIVDRASMTAAIRSTFPLDPAWHGPSWDALADSLWEGLFQHPARRLLIAWPGAGALFGRAEDDYLVLTDVLEQVAETLADPQATVGNPKELAVVIEQRHRDDALHAVCVARALRELVEMDCAEPFRSQLRAEIAACARGELPTKRIVETNTFSIVLDARVGGVDVRSVVSESPDGSVLLTFGEVLGALDRAA